MVVGLEILVALVVAGGIVAMQRRADPWAAVAVALLVTSALLYPVTASTLAGDAFLVMLVWATFLPHGLAAAAAIVALTRAVWGRQARGAYRSIGVLALCWMLPLHVAGTVRHRPPGPAPAWSEFYDPGGSFHATFPGTPTASGVGPGSYEVRTSDGIYAVLTHALSADDAKEPERYFDRERDRILGTGLVLDREAPWTLQGHPGRELAFASQRRYLHDLGLMRTYSMARFVISGTRCHQIVVTLFQSDEPNRASKSFMESFKLVEPLQWRPFASADGTWRVLFPGEPTVTKTPRANPVLVNDVEETTVKLGIRGVYSVMAARFDWDRIGLAHGDLTGVVERIATPFEKKYHVLSSVEISRDGAHGREIVYEAPAGELTAVLTHDVWASGDTMFQVIVQQHRGHEDESSAMTFLESFHLLAPADSDDRGHSRKTRSPRGNR
ncbi:MAG: hypothetical protein U0166_22250 [Acidobacteriota bacterium]